MSQNKDVPLREVLTLQLFFMRIDILTVLPEMIEGMINCSIVKRAQDKDRTDRPGDLSVEKRTGI